ncbi:uncharacterized protein [Dysidea avara]|uniref:uncharacterized protein n=1 Tax=Dysidea avara TaxID=196820 RepID=UPI0033345E6C
MGVGQYNGTSIISGVDTDVWWFPGTNDAENDPCYGYWSATDDSKRPVQFFGLASSGRDGGAILDYYTFIPGEIPEDIPMTKPNNKCDEECVALFENSLIVGWPEWPYCQ